jgi:hypothetical protein
VWNRCENPEHITPWQLVKIKPHNTQVARNRMIQELKCDDDSQYGGNIDDMTDLLEIGDHFAVIAEDNNDEGVPYYILQCQRTKFIIGEDFECIWGNMSKLGIIFWRAFTFRIGELDPKTTCTSMVHVQLSFTLIW